MTRIKNDQILDPADNFPVPCRIYLALIAGVKPALAQDLGGFVGPVPVPRKNIGTANDDFVRFPPTFISIPGMALPTRPGSTWRGIIHGANRCGFGESVHL